MGCVLEESVTDVAECHRMVVCGRRAVGTIMSLVNARGLQFLCARVMHEALIMPVLMYGSKNDMEGKGEV